jgi:hypothetical protein
MTQTTWWELAMGVSSADCMTFLDLGPFVPDRIF